MTRYTFEVLDCHGEDAKRWDAILAGLPWTLRDPHLMSGWAFLQGPEAIGKLAVMYEDGQPAVIQPFVLRPVPDSDTLWDMSAAGYGGPLPIIPLPGLDLRSPFNDLLKLWASQYEVVTEFYMVNPLLAARQAIMLPDGGYAERSVTVLDTDSIELRPNRRQSLAKAFGATVRSVGAELFWLLYHAAMERKGAAPRWQLSAEYFQRAQKLHPMVQYLGAFHGETPEAVAMFVVHGNGAYYHLAATIDPPRDGYADQLVMAGATMARRQGTSWLHLGGGLADRDGLDLYKSSFGGLRRTVFSVRAVHDSEAYARLSQGAGSTDYFPAYRAAEASK